MGLLLLIVKKKPKKKHTSQKDITDYFESHNL